jgi:hypothetical protein
MKGKNMSDATRATDDTAGGLTAEELAAEEVTALPDKEVVSILDLNVDADIALDLAAPVDLAVAANANVAAPIDAAVGANILSAGSTAQALSDRRRLHSDRDPGQRPRPDRRRGRRRGPGCA